MEVFGKLGINFQTLAFQIINFVILLWILKKILYTPILTILEDRRKKVAEGNALIEQAQEQSAQAKVEAESELVEAREKASEIIDRAQKQASETTKNANEEAREKAEELISNAKKAIASEKDALMDDVRDEIVGLVTQASAKVLGKELTSGQEDFIKAEVVKS